MGTRDRRADRLVFVRLASSLTRSVGDDAPDALTAPAPAFGRPRERQQARTAGFGALVVCVVYVLGVRTFAPEFAPGVIEFVGTVTSLWCVWITRRQNVLSIPIGIVSVVAMGVFFWQIGLIGQSLLHLVYYLPIQIVGWWMWTRGGTRGTELPVSRLPTSLRLALAPAIAAGTIVGGRLLDASFDQAVFSTWDASVVAASIIAQLLLMAKKTESWWLWIGPVNVSAIGLYLMTGAYMFAALYVVFLVNAFVGLAQWQTARRLRGARVLAPADR